VEYNRCNLRKKDHLLCLKMPNMNTDLAEITAEALRFIFSNRLYFVHSSLELFADGGSISMTEFFSKRKF
jgi:hypothetical protein